MEDISPKYPYSTTVITQQVLVFLLQLQQMIIVNSDFLGSQGVIQRSQRLMGTQKACLSCDNSDQNLASFI